MFPNPAHPTCRHNHVFKHLYRLKPGMVQLSDANTHAHQFFDTSRNEFFADGTNLSACRFGHSTLRYQAICHPKPQLGNGAYHWSRCNGLCVAAPLWQTEWRPRHPLLTLRHYMTRSITELNAKLDSYKSAGQMAQAKIRRGAVSCNTDAQCKWLEYIARRRRQMVELNQPMNSTGGHVKSSCEMVPAGMGERHDGLKAEARRQDSP